MSDLVRELEALDAKATKAPWTQGRTLMTAQTLRWTAEAIAKNDAMEASMVFSGFTPEDEGRSRQLVAEMADRNSDNAAVTAAIRNALPALIKYVKARTPETEAAFLAALRGGK